jgi:hypothetical protein
MNATPVRENRHQSRIATEVISGPSSHRTHAGRRCPATGWRAQRPDHAWAVDFQFDVTDDGRAVKLLYVVDEFTREALAMVAERRIDGDKVVDGAGPDRAPARKPPRRRRLRRF